MTCFSGEAYGGKFQIVSPCHFSRIFNSSGQYFTVSMCTCLQTVIPCRNACQMDRYVQIHVEKTNFHYVYNISGRDEKGTQNFSQKTRREEIIWET
jgi:hypothetical protein